jgi:hypothetical protein
VQLLHKIAPGLLRVTADLAVFSSKLDDLRLSGGPGDLARQLQRVAAVVLGQPDKQH